MLSCKEVAQRAGDWTDGTLSFREKLSVRLHLLICAFCRRFIKQYKLAADTAAHQACQHHPDEVHAVLQKIADAPRDPPSP